MQFTIDRAKLANNIQHSIVAVPAKNINPMLLNFLVEADMQKQQIVITATDMDVTIIVRIQTNVTEEGKIAVSARNLLEIINSLEDKPIDFRTENEYLKIRCSHSNFSLLCADPSQFPLTIPISFEDAVIIPAQIFSKMISIAGIAVSQEGSRPIFTGIMWRVTSDQQVMAATDGKKISEVKKALKFDIEDKMENVIPPKGLSFLEKVIVEETPEIKVLFKENRVYFSYLNYLLITQTIAGRFPDYEKVLLTNNPYSLIIDKNLIKQAIRRVALLSTEEYYRIKFDISEKSIIISSFNSEMGDATDELSDFEYSGPEFSIAFNYKYILSIINVLETDKMKMTFSEPEGGIVNNQVMFYNHPDVDNYQANILLMPLRLK